ncbi:hypothetical protein ACFX2J_045445 [Malus domestica]
MRTRFMDMRYKIGPRESAKKVVVSPAIFSKYQPSDRLTPCFIFYICSLGGCQGIELSLVVGLPLTSSSARNKALSLKLTRIVSHLYRPI